MSSLIVCAGCQRHIHLGDSQCPFCGQACAPEARPLAPIRPKRRIARLAGAALTASIAQAGCGGNEADTTPIPADAGQPDTGVIYGDVYGAPADAGPIDSGVAEDASPIDSGEQEEAGVIIGDVYGAPADSGLLDSGPAD